LWANQIRAVDTQAAALQARNLLLKSVANVALPQPLQLLRLHRLSLLLPTRFRQTD
jgi:hypothetical protein